MITTIKNSIKKIPNSWKVPLIIYLGSFCGLLIFTLYSANFFSYLSDAPETCMNCHIMGPEYASWYHSSHREVATCNDCHVPNDNFFHHYLFKAQDGLRHSAVFTLNAQPQAIIIRDAGREAVQSNCKRCHSALFYQSQKMTENLFNEDNGQDRACWSCHRLTPHGDVRSLSSAPFARVPTTQSIVPQWLKEMIQKK